MQITALRVIYFSATGTTRKIVRAVASAFPQAAVTWQDITNSARRTVPLGEVAEDLLILALPVYEERIPPFVLDCLHTLAGCGQPAAAVGVYGNIGYGIILPEMQSLLNERGFVTVAGAGFIGEHSFSHAALPVAAGRPDQHDLDLARRFGEELAAYLAAYPNNGFDPHKKLAGQLPLMARILPPNSSPLFADIPQLDAQRCNACGACLRKCPLDAIDPQSFTTLDERCTRCFACVRSCPQQARSIRLKLKPVVRRFFKKPQTIRREPVWFFL